MITIDQAMRGVMRFADAEIGPHLPTGKAIGLGVALSLIAEGGNEQLLALRENPLIQTMGVMDEQGNVDLDRLYNAARPKLDGQKLPVTLPLIGELRFDVNDLDKLYKYIQEA